MNKTYKDIIQNGDVIKYDISQHDKHFNSLIDNKIRYIENGISTPMNPKEVHLTKDTFLFVGTQANTFRGHEYVDMGLPSGTKWATCNVGASSPEEFGTPYAWGEVFDKSIFTPESSVFYNFPATGLSPSNNISPAVPVSFGFSGRYLMDVALEKWHIEYYDKNSVDYEFNFPIGDDPQAYKVPDGFDGTYFTNPIMGNNLYYLFAPSPIHTWRTPRLDDFIELLSNCTLSRSDGYIMFTSNINNNVLKFPPTTPFFENFPLQSLPIAGCYYTSHESDEISTSAYGISQFPDTSNYKSSIDQCGIGIVLDGMYGDTNPNYVILNVPKYYGMYIRPVVSI